MSHDLSYYGVNLCPVILFNDQQIGATHVESLREILDGVPAML